MKAHFAHFSRSPAIYRLRRTSARFFRCSSSVVYQDVIDVNTHVWHTLQDALHCPLEYGWCGSHPEWQPVVGTYMQPLEPPFALNNLHSSEAVVTRAGGPQYKPVGKNVRHGTHMF